MIALRHCGAGLAVERKRHTLFEVLGVQLHVEGGHGRLHRIGRRGAGRGDGDRPAGQSHRDVHRLGIKRFGLQHGQRELKLRDREGQRHIGIHREARRSGGLLLSLGRVLRRGGI